MDEIASMNLFRNRQGFDTILSVIQGIVVMVIPTENLHLRLLDATVIALGLLLL